MINAGIGVWINVLGALLTLILGVLVLLVRPRQGPNRAFFVYALGFSVGVSAYNLWIGQPIEWPVLWAVTGAGYLLATIGVVWLALVYPIRFRRDEYHLLILPLITAAAIFATNRLADVIGGDGALAAHYRLLGFHPETIDTALWAYAPWTDLFAAALGFFIVLAPLRFRHLLQRTGEPMPELALMGAALATWIGIIGGSVLGVATSSGTLQSVVGVAGIVLAAALWLWACDGVHGRLGRNMAWYLTALPLFGLAVHALGGGIQGAMNVGLFGVGRTIAVGLIAFSIVRHQILGIEVKVRWTVSRGTIAAAFIAVFFIVSELTAELIGGTSAGPVAGVLAAGVLVFFLAPLQRWADRLAGAATGDARPVETLHGPQAITLYRRQAVAAWANGHVDAQERALLDELRDGLELSHKQAAEIESEAAQQLRG